MHKIRDIINHNNRNKNRSVKMRRILSKNPFNGKIRKEYDYLTK